jgi:acyl dehydratase|tara:strand:+ start:613 stop:1056 length:444 start_codon:yes stop_codon:yes gene_type:complete
MNYFESFKLGEIYKLNEYKVAEVEMLEFATKYDPQSYHTDPTAAAQSPFGSLIASGWHTAAIFMRMQCDSFLSQSHCLGSPGVDQLRWIAPVRPGDSLHGENKIVQLRPSRSKPDRGIVQSAVTIYNQKNDLVMTLETTAFFLKRPD